MNQISQALEDTLGRNGAQDREGSLEVLSGTGGGRFIDFPAGSTAQRPASPETGYARYNTTTDQLEFWNGTTWRNFRNPVTVVTYGNLDATGGVGTNANQASRGNHTH